MSDKLVTYRQSKLGNEMFTPSHRIGIMFTYNLDDTSELDEINPEFLVDSKGSLAGLIDAVTNTGAVTNVTGNGYGPENAKKNLQTAKGTQEILVGAGIRSLSVEQQINVTQEGTLGWFDIAETISQNVSSNTLNVEKMMLRLRQLSNNGVAPWGKDVLTSPRLNAYVLDVKEYQRGIDLGFTKLMGLHLNSNRLNASLGQTVTENVSFRADRVLRVKRIPTALYASMKKQYRTLLTGVEQLDSYYLDPGDD